LEKIGPDKRYGVQGTKAKMPESGGDQENTHQRGWKKSVKNMQKGVHKKLKKKRGTRRKVSQKTLGGRMRWGNKSQTSR